MHHPDYILDAKGNVSVNREVGQIALNQGIKSYITDNDTDQPELSVDAIRTQNLLCSIPTKISGKQLDEVR